MKSDAELLQAFLDARSEAAFTELVQRYLPLVYGAALRRVGGDAHRAQDIAQVVFTDFARKAPALRNHPAIAGWFYKAANNSAAKTMRTEQRRVKRELVAQSIADGDDIPWDSIRPVIDDALLDLPDADRLTVLLRFFQNESFPAIGARLGLTDSGARMRTERALESLRAALAKRGITSTGAVIGGALVAHGAATVPYGMAAAIAGNAVAASAAGTGLFLMSTSTIKIGLATAALVAGAIGLVLENRANEQLRSQVKSLQSDLRASDRRALANLRSGVAVSKAYEDALARLGAGNPELSPNDSLVAWTTRLAKLKERLAQQPDQSIPEFALLTDTDWLDASKAGLDTDEDYRKAMAALRGAAESKFVTLARSALKNYVATAGSPFPTDVMQLQAYFDSAIDPAILQRWAVMPASEVGSIHLGGDSIISEKAPVDGGYDSRYVIGLNGTGGTTWAGANKPAILAPVWAAYKAANNGQMPRDLTQALPYATTPEQQALLQKMTSDLSVSVK